MPLGQKEQFHRYRRYASSLTHLYEQKKVRTYAGIVASLLTTSFFIIFAIKPTAVTIASLIKETADQRVIADTLDKKIVAISQAQWEYGRFSPYFILVDESLPDNPWATQLSSQIEAVAFKNNVFIARLSFGQIPLLEKIAVEPKEVIALTVNVLGEYSQLKLFFEQFTKLRRSLAISGLEFRPSPSQEASQAPLMLTIEAIAYFTPEKT